MITYKISPDPQFVQQFLDGVATGVWANVETNQQYLKWLEAGNTPEPAEEQ
jgi:hypothetical protein